MSTPKEKAKELIEKHKEYVWQSQTDQRITMTYLKEAVLITVEEVLENLEPLRISHLGTYQNPSIDFWQEVKSEVIGYEN